MEVTNAMISLFNKLSKKFSKKKLFYFIITNLFVKKKWKVQPYTQFLRIQRLFLLNLKLSNRNKNKKCFNEMRSDFYINYSIPAITCLHYTEFDNYFIFKKSMKLKIL